MPPAQLTPQPTHLEQDVPLGSGHQSLPVTAEDVPAWAHACSRDAEVIQRLALQQYQRLAREKNQV